MKIKVGKTSGFCYGVKNAVDKANSELDKRQNQKIYCLGELVHNKTVIEELEEKGLRIIENLDEAENVCIGRAHGVSKEDYTKLKEKKVELIDLTCPSVLKTHNIAEKYAKENFYIFLIGQKDHPEIIATYSFCGQNSSIISEKKDLKQAEENLEKSGLKKILVIEQTTYSVKKFNELQDMIEKEFSNKYEIEIKNTICLATEKRQEETKNLSKEVDLMIIVGGKKSSNTNKLFEIAKENCKNAVFVENKEELDLKNARKFETIGIMAGASTPQKIVDDIMQLLNCT